MTTKNAQQNDLFQKQLRNTALLQSQFKLYPDHMVLLKEGDSVTITFRDMNGLTTFLRRKEIARGDCFILDSLPMSDGYCCALIGSVSRNQPTPAVTIRDILLRDCNKSSVALYPRGEGLSVNFWKKKGQMHSKSLLVAPDDLGTSRVDSVGIWTDRLAFDFEGFRAAFDSLDIQIKIKVLTRMSQGGGDHFQQISCSYEFYRYVRSIQRSIQTYAFLIIMPSSPSRSYNDDWLWPSPAVS